MRLRFSDHTTMDDDTFVARHDGDVLLVIGRGRRTGGAPIIDVFLPCFPLVRSLWSPLHEGRPCRPLVRQSGTAWTIEPVPAELSLERRVWLIEVPEVLGNGWQRAADAAATLAEAQARPTPRVTPHQVA